MIPESLSLRNGMEAALLLHQFLSENCVQGELFKMIFVDLRVHKFQKDTTKPYPIALPGLPDPLKCSDQTAKDSAVTKPN